MSDSVLQKSLPYLLGMIASGSGVTIRTDPNAVTAATNGDVVFFPPLPYTGEELAIYSVGYLVHEAGHLRSTDFIRPDGFPSSPLVGMLFNILEDVRIERLMNSALPGARFWLNALTQKLVDTGKQGVIDPDVELTRSLLRYLLDWLFESVLGYPALVGIGQAQRDVWRSKVSITLANAVEAVAVSAAWAASTAEVHAAAVEIVRLIQDEAEQAERSAGGEDSSDVQPNPPSGGEGENEQGGQKPDTVKASQNDQSQNNQAVEDSTGPTSQLDGSDEPDDTTNGTGKSYAQTLAQVLQSEQRDEGKDRGDVIRDEMGASLGELNLGEESLFILPVVLPAQYGMSDAPAVAAVRASSTALQYRMEEFLQTSTQSRISYSERGKRLSRDGIRKFATGDMRIYQKRTVGREIDTAIHILIDISQSMYKDDRYKVAVSSALSVCLALDDVDGVQYSVSAFPFHSHDVIEVVKTGETARSVASRFSLLKPNGSTPLDKGLMHAHTALMTVQATRRVCLVIGDGEPDDLAAAVALLNMGEEEGIEHMAIGIASSAAHITSNACLVMDIAELPAKLSAMMQTAILLPLAA